VRHAVGERLVHPDHDGTDLAVAAIPLEHPLEPLQLSGVKLLRADIIEIHEIDPSMDQ
jgi:hypothetical protein